MNSSLARITLICMSSKQIGSITSTSPIEQNSSNKDSIGKKCNASSNGEKSNRKITVSPTLTILELVPYPMFTIITTINPHIN